MDHPSPSLRHFGDKFNKENAYEDELSFINLILMKTNIQRVKTLYKTILKLHRGLPEELNILGTNYVRDEFKRHKSCNANEAEIFMKEWVDYAITLGEQLGLREPHSGKKLLGVSLSQADINRLRDEQLYQLYELMRESTKLK